MGTGGNGGAYGPNETRPLRREIEQALRHAFDPADVLPRLDRLSRLASPWSEDGIFAHRKLAELLVERHPWRAAIYAKRALAYDGSDDRSWAVLAFSHTLLGHFRSAVAAYKRATACAPSNPWYAHNLGHLLDVALGEPALALPWLRTAYLAKSDNSEIVASYVHALAAAARMTEAKRVLDDALQRFDSHELGALKRWVAAGAPSRRTRTDGGTDDAPRKPKRPRAADRHVARFLEQGLARLPLDERQRERAFALARDVARVDRAAASLPLPEVTASPTDRAAPASGVEPGGVEPGGSHPGDRSRTSAGIAAAVAYAIVYVDQVPLSQAEVAAPFRVAVAELRGRFAELRAKLDLIRGDVRYTTTRSR